jgi:NAD(P)-dependent dehydrogenase (short-subunit alcohol dehydrogenase family)
MAAGLADKKVALVTGAGSGIGRATALLFGEQGATGVAVSDIDLEAAEETCDLLRSAGHDAFASQVDVSDSTMVDGLLASTLERYGHVDCAVNNAGTRGPWGNVLEVTDEQWRETFAVNLDSVFYCLRAEIRAMLDSGGGSIVNISSGSTSDPIPNLFPYATTKFGVLGLTRAVAGQFPSQGIRVNAVLPGRTDTPMIRQQRGAGAGSQLPQSTDDGSRMGRPDELAQAIVWLCSDAASWVHGQGITIDGGSHAYRGGEPIR